MTLWNRYLLKMFLNCFVLCILSFYFLYILLDYSSHPDRFYFDHQFQWTDFFLYYLCEFLRRFSSIAPFALLVSCIKVMCQLVLNNEFIAMMASGVTVKRLLRPILLFGFLMTLLIFINAEFFIPSAIHTLNRINDAHKFEKKQYRERPIVQQVSLKDDTTLIFQKYDSSRNLFLEVFWISNIDDIYHMKTLNFSEKAPIATFVDHLARNQEGELARIASYKEKTFPEIRLSKRSLREIITPPEEQSISKLWKKLPKEKDMYSDKEAQILAAFYNKLALPWLCLFAVIAPIPFCLNFTRRHPVFMIYAFGLFGLVAFIIILNSALILGKRQVIEPFFVTWIPFFMIIGYFGQRYLRLN